MPEDQRYFLSLSPHDEVYDWRFFKTVFLIPFGLYFLWAFLYYLKMFVISPKKIAERNYETLFIYFMNMKTPNRIL